jgi:hypothetical protein
MNHTTVCTAVFGLTCEKKRKVGPPQYPPKPNWTVIKIKKERKYKNKDE